MAATQLSPEKYLTLITAGNNMVHREGTSPPDNHAQEPVPRELAGIDIKWVEITPRTSTFVDALREKRLLRFSVDIDTVQNTNNLRVKYCVPVTFVMNQLFLHETVPQLQAVTWFNQSGSLQAITSTDDPSDLNLSPTGRPNKSPRLPVSDSGCILTTVVLAAGTTLTAQCKDSQPGSGSDGRSDRRGNIDWHVASMYGVRPRAAKDVSDHPRWDTHSKAFVVVMFLQRGTLRKDTFVGEQSSRKVQIQHDRPEVALAVKSLLHTLHETKSPFGILTDETTTFLVDHRCFGDPLVMPHLCRVPPSITISLLAGNCVWQEAAVWKLLRPAAGPIARQAPLQGRSAGSRESSMPSEEEMATYRCLSDFDLPSIESCFMMTRTLLKWLETQQMIRRANPLTVGSAIAFHTYGLQDRRRPMKERHEDLQFVHQILAGRVQPPKNHLLSDFISSNKDLVVEVTKVVQDLAEEGYSVVVLGRLARRGELESEEACIQLCDEDVCVKLYDERCLTDLCNRGDGYLQAACSEESALREEAAYYSLRAAQGTLLPHCYGFYQFTLPDGWKCYGVILENIQASTLDNILSSQTTSLAVQRSLTSQIRLGVRVLRSRNIHQRDWHGQQILCIADKDTQSADVSRDAQGTSNAEDSTNYQVVFIDFALTDTYLGDETCVPTGNDVRAVRGLLERYGIDEQVLRETWLPEEEFEY